MNFTIWILNRIKQSLLGGEQWEWVSDYRRLILRSKVESILITVFGGLVWFVLCGGVCLALVDTRETFFFVMQCVILSVPAFYMTNWIAALYEIYDAERMATWDRLKDPR